MEQLALGLVWYAVLLFSLTLHEAAHAWAAKRGGDPTAYLGGQASLDPRPHLRREPFGMVLVPLLSFSLSGWMIGWASTPYDPRWAYSFPRRAGWMSLAGPAANLVLVAVAAAFMRAGIAAGLLEPGLPGFTGLVLGAGPAVTDAVAQFLSILFGLNLLLCVFNLLPVPPLDGAGGVAVLLPEDWARRLQLLMAQPLVAFAGVLVAWFTIPFLFGPVYVLALALVLPELL
jgi:Zn-dependent protease